MKKQKLDPGYYVYKDYPELRTMFDCRDVIHVGESERKKSYSRSMEGKDWGWNSLVKNRQDIREDTEFYFKTWQELIAANLNIPESAKTKKAPTDV